jgi:hypothetical protein
MNWERNCIDAIQHKTADGVSSKMNRIFLHLEHPKGPQPLGI